ncbi:MAG: hypothetical protein VXY99_01200, partial [Pseudomonadota bacterium]|nr:hypothetical protein [Pseudomonadota bacterium]
AGQSATAAFSAPGVNAQAVVALPTVTASVGSVTVVGVDAEANVNVTGQAGTTGVGSLTVTGKANLTLTGQAGTSALGTVTPNADANVSLAGVSATGEVGENLIVWFEFDTTQTPNYSNITDTQTPSWSEISENQTPSWEEVA